MAIPFGIRRGSYPEGAAIPGLFKPISIGNFQQKSIGNFQQMEQAIYSLTISPSSMSKQRPLEESHSSASIRSFDPYVSEAAAYNHRGLKTYARADDYSPYDLTIDTNPPPTLHIMEEEKEYEEYLSSILLDFGLQLSPDGSRIELDQTQLPVVQNNLNLSDDGKNEIESVNLPPSEEQPFLTEATATTLPYSKFRKITKFNNKSSQDSKDDLSPVEHLPPLPQLEPLSLSTQHQELKRKVKKYECQESFTDPEEERKRLNAINARRNRVKQKHLTKSLQEEKKSLEATIEKCLLALKKINADHQKLSQEVKDRKRRREVIEQLLQDKDDEIRRQREMLLLYSSHLDLIADTLEEENPAKRLIQQLLKKLSNDIPRPRSSSSAESLLANPRPSIN